MFRPKTCLAVLLCLVLFLQLAAIAQTPDPQINDQIRAEETAHSEIMRTMHFLTDIYGPRLTGSPNHKAAADWALTRMKSWGFENAHLEPWTSDTRAGRTSAPAVMCSRRTRTSSAS